MVQTPWFCDIGLWCPVYFANHLAEEEMVAFLHLFCFHVDVCFLNPFPTYGTLGLVSDLPLWYFLTDLIRF